MSETRWGAVIRGEARDLEDWISVLKEPFDPWVEIHGNDTVLRSRAFDELTSAGEVRVHAFAQIQRLNGAMAVSQGAGPVEFDDIVVEFSPDGNRRRLLFGAVTASARSRA